MREILSDIYYKIHFYYVTVSGGASIAGKITVRVDADATRAHFGGGGGVVKLTKLFGWWMYWNPPKWRGLTKGRREGLLTNLADLIIIMMAARHLSL